MAETLALEGYETHLVTSHSVVSPISDATLEGSKLRAHLHSLGVRTHCETTPTEISPDRVSGHGEFGEPWSRETDGVVLVTQQESDNALYRELVSDASVLDEAGIEAMYCIGDAVSPRMISEVIFDGHRLGREIDSPDPRLPHPEHLVRVNLRGGPEPIAGCPRRTTPEEVGHEGAR